MRCCGCTTQSLFPSTTSSHPCQREQPHGQRGQRPQRPMCCCAIQSREIVTPSRPVRPLPLISPPRPQKGRAEQRRSDGVLLIPPECMPPPLPCGATVPALQRTMVLAHYPDGSRSPSKPNPRYLEVRPSLWQTRAHRKRRRRSPQQSGVVQSHGSLVECRPARAVKKDM